jgi:hypothetical protein
MLQNILKVDGISPLDKSQQKNIIGGNPCGSYSGPICFGIGLAGCGSCADYQALPPAVQGCVLVSFDCFDDFL